MKTSRAKTNKSILKKQNSSPFQTCKLTGTEKLEKKLHAEVPRHGRTKEKTVAYQKGNHPKNECYWLLNSYTFMI